MEQSAGASSGKADPGQTADEKCDGGCGKTEEDLSGAGIPERAPREEGDGPADE